MERLREKQDASGIGASGDEGSNNNNVSNNPAREILERTARKCEEPLLKLEKHFSKEAWERMTNSSLKSMRDKMDDTVKRFQTEVEKYSAGNQDSVTSKLEKDVRLANKDVKDAEDEIAYIWDSFNLYAKDKSNSREEIERFRRSTQQQEAGFRAIIRDQLEVAKAEKEKKLQEHLKSLLGPIQDGFLERLNNIDVEYKKKFAEMRRRPDKWLLPASWEDKLQTPSGNKIIDWASRSPYNQYQDGQNGNKNHQSGSD